MVLGSNHCFDLYIFNIVFLHNLPVTPDALSRDPMQLCIGGDTETAKAQSLTNDGVGDKGTINPLLVTNRREDTDSDTSGPNQPTKAYSSTAVHRNAVVDT